MKIVIRRNVGVGYDKVKLQHGEAVIELGLLNADERDELAQALIQGVYDMGPTQYSDCNDWLDELILKVKVLP